ncbi:MAG: fasciclin [Burkholderiales bacterium PBB3]|nr:MAG: fasciclin [Burkholderiales bacterium PBB3]
MSFSITFASATRRTALVAALLTLMSGCATMSGPVSVADTIAADPALSTLNGLVQSAGLTETLKGTGPFTVFAPTNDAFKAVPAKTMEALGKDPVALKGVLTYHVLPGTTLAANVKNGKVKTVNGAELELNKAGDFVTVGESAIVTKANVTASNGVVHVVDAVLLPPAKK